jgi:hypothetical protein
MHMVCKLVKEVMFHVNGTGADTVRCCLTNVSMFKHASFSPKAAQYDLMQDKELGSC